MPDAVLVYVDRPQTMEAVDASIAAKIPLVWLHDALSRGAAIPAAITSCSRQVAASSLGFTLCFTLSQSIQPISV